MYFTENLFLIIVLINLVAIFLVSVFNMKVTKNISFYNLTSILKVLGELKD